MIEKRKKVELLAPAGTPEKLEIAIHYGADAVYLAGKAFSLRNFSANFSMEEMKAARNLTRDKGIKMYVAVNIYSRNSEADAITDYLCTLAKIEPDALIVADPAIFLQAKERMPQIPIHISTQANTTNVGTVRFWKNLGATRVNAARELTFKEIDEMAQKGGIEIEAFVHGAMCMAYSGRCLLSGYMENRESNRGMCCQPCRFHYAVMEETRPGQYFPIAEDPRGAYIFNSRDLCMIEHIPEMIGTGICSLKVEGRMKSIHYLAGVLKTYREAIDTWYADPDAYKMKARWVSELLAISNRGYCTGFYLDNPQQTSANIDNISHPGYRFIAKVTGRTSDGGARVLVKNKFFVNEMVNILLDKGPTRTDTIEKIIDKDGMEKNLAQPGSIVTVFLKKQPSPLELIRIPVEEADKESS